MLLISPRAWQMMTLAVRHNPKLEVGGFAKAIVTEAGVEVVDILIPPQEIGGAHVDIEVEALDWLMGQVLARGDQPKDWFVWWHSHASMSTGPSGTDHHTLGELARQHAAGFAVGLVVNVKGESTAWATYRSPLMPTHYVEQTMDVTLLEDFDPELEELVAGFMEHVTEKKWAPVPMSISSKKGKSKGNGKQAPVVYSEQFKQAAWKQYVTDGWQSLTDAQVEAAMQMLEDRKDDHDMADLVATLGEADACYEEAWL